MGTLGCKVPLQLESKLKKNSQNAMNYEKQQPRQKNGLKGKRTRIVVLAVEKRSITMSI